MSRVVKKTSGQDENGFVKKTASDQRNRTLHGSPSLHGMAIAGGTLRRMREKPQGRRKP